MKHWDTLSKTWVYEGEPTPLTPSATAPVLKQDSWAKLTVRYEATLDRLWEHFAPGPIPVSRMPEKPYRFDMVCVDGKGWVPA